MNITRAAKTGLRPYLNLCRINKNIRQISCNSSLLTKKPSSEVEETVKAVKEAQKKAEGKEVIVKPKKTISYGFKRLVLGANISLTFNKIRINELKRRVLNLFVKTIADRLRLVVPVPEFVIEPFLKMILNSIFKIYGMLPSKFQTKVDMEAKLNLSLKVNLEMAKFPHAIETNKEFADFFSKVRQGVVIPADEILKFSKLFKDEIILDSLSRPQLIALCREFKLLPFGTSNFLRRRLLRKLRSLAIDDKEVTSTDLKSLENTNENLSAKQKKLIVEKEKIKEFKDILKDLEEDIHDLQEVMKTEKEEQIRESKAAKCLFKIGINLIKLIKISDEYKLQKISKIDHDGLIKLDTVLKEIELIVTENVKVLDDMKIKLVSKEEEMETLEKKNKVQKIDKDDHPKTSTKK